MMNTPFQTNFHQEAAYQVFKAQRNWGFEYLIACVPKRYTVKILKLNSGSQGGLQYHHFKVECGLVLSGQLEVSIMRASILDTYSLRRNDFFLFPPGLIHQEKAVLDTVILETSTPHFNDRVRLDNDDNNTLLSTLASDVFEITSITQLSQLSIYGFEPSRLDQVPCIHLVKFPLQ